MRTWVLIRGLTRSAAHWVDFARLLEQALGDARIVTLDLPGNGALHLLQSPSRIEAMVTHCREQLRQLGVAPPFDLIGISLGAMVAVEWAAQAPHTTASCVLVNTSLRGLNPWHRRLRPSSLTRLLAIALAPGEGPYKERLVLALTSRNAIASAAVLEQWVRLRREQPVSVANSFNQLLAAARYRAPERPEAPLLLLSSAGDELVDPRCSAQIAKRWRCRHAVHPWAGHDLPLDDGPWMVEQVRAWFDQGCD